MRVAVVFDDEPRPETTGVYCLSALKDLCEGEHFRPKEVDSLSPSQFDLFLRIDDGTEYQLPSALRPSAVWFIDTHLNLDQDARLAGGYDIVFAAQRDGAEQLSRRGHSQAEWLPLACDPKVHRKMETGLKQYDIAFVGNLFPGPRLELLQLLKYNFSKVFVGQAYFEEMARTYSAARIVFNRSVLNDVNMRVFEALSCGSLLLTNDLAANGLAELFEDGVHLATYRSEEELVDKARFYLRNETSRETIAAAGRAVVHAKHTYRHRMARILELAEKSRKPISVSPGTERRPAPPQPRASITRHGYYEHARPEILELIPGSARRVLDVGCGAGKLGEALKRRQSAVVIGMEMSRDAAEAAAFRLDEVIVGDAEWLERDFAEADFDAIVCGDVLEHFCDPSAFLRRARGWLAPGGVLIASIPNARHFSVIAPLLDGNWSYEPAGIMDATHMRFYTRRDIIELFHGSGFRLQRISPIPGLGYAEWERSEKRQQVRIGRMTLVGVPVQEAEEFFVYQYLVVAAPASHAERPNAARGLVEVSEEGQEPPTAPRLLAHTAGSRMRFTQDFRKDFEAFDLRGEPFAFVRFGDGERSICMGKPLDAADGWSYNGGSTSFSRDLMASLECDMEDYYIGISDRCCDAESHEWFLTRVRVPLERLTFANIFVNANYERFRSLDFSGIAIVAPRNADILIPENLVERSEDIDGIVARLLDIDRPILVAAGPAANVIVHKYWLRARNRQTIVDVGSALDERLKGIKSRRYHFSGSPTANRVCRW